jgi:hypothetical protein
LATPTLVAGCLEQQSPRLAASLEPPLLHLPHRPAAFLDHPERDSEVVTTPDSAPPTQTLASVKHKTSPHLEDSVPVRPQRVRLQAVVSLVRLQLPEMLLVEALPLVLDSELPNQTLAAADFHSDNRISNNRARQVAHSVDLAQTINSNRSQADYLEAAPLPVEAYSVLSNPNSNKREVVFSEATSPLSNRAVACLAANPHQLVVSSGIQQMRVLVDCSATSNSNNSNPRQAASSVPRTHNKAAASSAIELQQPRLDLEEAYLVKTPVNSSPLAVAYLALLSSNNNSLPSVIVFSLVFSNKCHRTSRISPTTLLPP